MKHTDEQIREIFSGKLGNHESPVSADLWNALQAKLPAAAGMASAGAGATVVGAIWKISAAILVLAGGIVASIYLMDDGRDITAVEQQVSSTETGNGSQSIQDQIQVADKSAEELSAPQSLENVEVTSTDKAISNAVQERVSESLNSDKSVDSEPIHNPESNIKNYIPDNSGNLQSTGNDGEVSENNLTVGSGSGQTGSHLTDGSDVQLNAEFVIIPVDLHVARYSFNGVEMQDVELSWDFGDGHVSHESSPVHQYDSEGVFVVKRLVRHKSGVTATSEQYLSVSRPGKVVIPNVFSPNLDGSNDLFDPSILSEGVEFTSIQIFDKKGNLVFKSDGKNFWDGNDSGGNPCDVGTYSYDIRGIDRNHEMTENRGYVLLVR